MQDRETRLAEKLRRIDYNLARVTEAERIEIFELGRAARIEIWSPGLRWPSNPDAGRSGGELTRL